MMSGKDELVFAPLGGLGEIGMNAALYGFGPKAKRKWILVDLGVAFAVRAAKQRASLLTTQDGTYVAAAGDATANASDARSSSPRSRPRIDFEIEYRQYPDYPAKPSPLCPAI